jgi:hypothetical protein
MNTLKDRRVGVTFDSLLAAIDSVADQIKVLVAALDDVRCEVEWQARNLASNQQSNAAVLESAIQPDDEWTDGVGDTAPASPHSVEAVDDSVNAVAEQKTQSPIEDRVNDSLLSAAGRLRAYEDLLFRSRRGMWLDEFVNEDDFEIPESLVFSVDGDLWMTVLDVRPAHVVGEGCCCEEDMGSPFLLAQRTEREFLLRELADEESHQLQELCLACQAERADAAAQDALLAPGQAQLGLF